MLEFIKASINNLRVSVQNWENLTSFPPCSLFCNNKDHNMTRDGITFNPQGSIFCDVIMEFCDVITPYNASSINFNNLSFCNE